MHSVFIRDYYISDTMKQRNLKVAIVIKSVLNKPEKKFNLLILITELVTFFCTFSTTKITKKLWSNITFQRLLHRAQT